MYIPSHVPGLFLVPFCNRQYKGNHIGSHHDTFLEILLADKRKQQFRRRGNTFEYPQIKASR